MFYVNVDVEIRCSNCYIRVEYMRVVVSLTRRRPRTKPTKWSKSHLVCFNVMSNSWSNKMVIVLTKHVRNDSVRVDIINIVDNDCD
ncbi:hypothetical protein [Candidatus Hodgkinia cicadicola]|uniref:hypothetical protein n=1 Tax=Candidatus Hodgkinia cicadicola TaxID=573658 RepID=UPI0011BA5EEC